MPSSSSWGPGPILRKACQEKGSPGMLKPPASQSKNRKGTFKAHLDFRAKLKENENPVIHRSPPSRHANLNDSNAFRRVTRVMSSALQQKSCHGSAKDWPEENPVSKRCLARRSCVMKYLMPRLATASFSLTRTSGATLAVRLVKAPASNLPMLKARATELTFDQS